MTKKKTAKALFASVLALVLCLSMLIGTTFAWFTDSVTSKNNVIKSGNLDVVLEFSKDGTSWAEVEETTALFSEDSLWEPGHTEYVYLRVKNAGSLALKYVLSAEVYTETEGTNMAGEPFKLSESLKYGAVKGYTVTTREAAVAEAVNAMTAGMDISGVTVTDINAVNFTENELKSGETVETALIITMPTTVGNEANHKTGTEAPKITFGVNLYATQLTYETDSFGPDYDEEAFYGDYVEVSANGTSVADALANASSGEKLGIKLASDMEWVTTGSHGENDVTSASGVTIDGQGQYALVATGAGVTPIGDNDAPLTLKNMTVSDRSVSYAEDAWEFSYLELGGSELYCENVVFTDPIMVESQKATFVNCSFVGYEDTANGIKMNGVWMYNGDAEFINCTFTGTRGMKICDMYTGGEVGTVVIDGCTFNGLTQKPGVAIDDEDVQDMNITIRNSTFLNCQPGDQGLYVYETDNTVPTVSNNTVINGEKLAEGLYADLTARPKQFYVSSGEGMAAFAQWRNSNTVTEGSPISVVCNLTCDIDMEGIAYNAYNGHFTQFNGNGYTISNLNAGQGISGKGGLVSYLGGGIIQDLTLEDATVTGCQVGLFAGQTEGGKILNCSVKGDNTVIWSQNTTSSYVETWGGIGAVVGYSSGGTFNVTIEEGATVVLVENGMTSEGSKVDELTGYGMTNSGTVVNNGTVGTGINSAESFLALGGKSLSGTYILTEDIDLGGAAAATIGAAYGKKLTVIGNGHTISNATTAHTNHNGMKHHGLFYAYTDSTLNISDLMIEKVTIDATADTERNYGAGIVVAFADGGSTVNLDNVDVYNCAVKNNTPDIGDEAGVYVGYQTGTLNMTDCDSTGCTVAGETAEKTGAMIGMVNGTATLTNCTTDLTIGTCNRVSGTLTEN